MPDVDTSTSRPADLLRYTPFSKQAATLGCQTPLLARSTCNADVFPPSYAHE